MPLSKSSMGPDRIVIRPSALLPVGAGPAVQDAVFGPAVARKPIGCAHADFVRLSVDYTPGAAGGAPALIAEGFDGVTWSRATIDNVGALFVLPPTATPGAQPGTASIVDAYVKWFQPRGAFSESFIVSLGKIYVAVRFDFAEYPVLTQATPGTLGAAVTLPSGV